ncbi:MAG: hypothetical protein NVSMB6_08840 [Burkholderiaceae bacterium]
MRKVISIFLPCSTIDRGGPISQMHFLADLGCEDASSRQLGTGQAQAQVRTVMRIGQGIGPG